MRFTIGWLFLIAVFTAGMLWAANAYVGRPDTGPELAMRVFGGLGSSVCTQATRELVAAGDGSASAASAELKARFERASSTVLEACREA